MGAGQQQGSTTSQTQPWTEQQPYLEQGFQQAANIYGQGPAAYYPGQTYSDLSDPTLQGLNAQTSIASSPNPLGANATSYATNVLGGNSDNPYSDILNSGTSGLQQTASGANLTNNPTLDSVYDAAARKVKQDYTDTVVPGISSQFGLGGEAGSTMDELAQGRAAGGLTDSLGSLAANIYGGNYTNERNLQQQAQTGLTNTGAGLYNTGVNQSLTALGLSPGLRTAQYGDAQQLQNAGSVYQGQADKAVQDDINRYNYTANAPTSALQDYLSMISGNYGSTSTSRSSSSSTGNPISTGIGAAGVLATLFGGA